MLIESLLLSRDTDAIRVLEQALAKLSIEVEVCRGARSGTDIIFKEKFDAVIVDCDDLQNAVGVLKDIRKSPSNRGSVAFAILNGTTTTQQAFELGATFVMQKPITPLSALRCLSAGLGLMVRERRRYFRYSVELEAILKFSQSAEIRATTTNVSESGMAIRAVAALVRGDIGNVIFNLPDERGIVAAKAEMVWVDSSGRAGMRFLEMSDKSHATLDEWLEQEIVRVDPLPDPKRFSH